MRPTTLLFGATSILGYHLAVRYKGMLVPFTSPGWSAAQAPGWQELNLESTDWIREIIQQHSPRLLLYCHAVCDVPKCEADPAWAYEINVGHLTRVLSELSDRTRLVYVSSDHVFGGDGTYDEDSIPCPISFYGRSRVEAERLVLSRPGSLVIRTGLAIGPSPTGRTGHLDWLRYRTVSQLPITIIEDEFRSAVWVEDLAERVMQLAESSFEGIRHISATRAVSRVVLARYLFSRMALEPNFVSAWRHQQPAPHLGHVKLATKFGGALSRPLNSVLDGSAPSEQALLS